MSSESKSSNMIEVTLASKWDASKENPTDYFLSEKLDGMRCVWDGTELWTRNGKKIHAPRSLVDALPHDFTLDGELFLGRGKFQDLMSIVNSGSTHPSWSRVKYAVFDSPTAPGDFLTRLAAIHAALVPSNCTYILEHTVCTGSAHAFAELDAVIARGGEGIMLRNPKAPYESGRSKNLLKFKRTLDAEARIIGIENGKGKNAGRMGALKCLMIPEGKEFKIGTGFTDAQRDRHPPIGSIVTYKYQELTKAGLPRFPVFDRVRPQE